MLEVVEIGEPAGQLDGAAVGPAVLGDVLAAGHDQLVGGAGVPADPDPGLGEVRFRAAK